MLAFACLCTPESAGRTRRPSAPPITTVPVLAALVSCLVTGWGCDRVLGRLSRDRVQALVEKDASFSPLPEVLLRRPADESLNGGILEGLWRLRGDWPATKVILKPRGLKVFRSIRPLGNDEDMILALQTPIRRRVVDVTGIRDLGSTRKEAHFTWALAEGLPAEVSRFSAAAFGSAPQEGKAEFEKFDDGWRVVKIEAPFPDVKPFSASMVDVGAFAAATQETVREMSAQVVGTWSGGTLGGPVRFQVTRDSTGSLAGVMEYSCATTRLALAPNSVPDALLFTQTLVAEQCGSLRGLDIIRGVSVQNALGAQVGVTVEAETAEVRWVRMQQGTTVDVASGKFVKVAATTAATAPAPPITTPGGSGAGLYLVAMRPRCCVVTGWQQDLVTALSARGTAAFPGAVLDGKVVRKPAFESRLDDVVIGPVASQDLDRFVGDLPAVVGPLATKLGDGGDPSVQGDPQQIFQIGMYQFQVIRP